MDRRVWILRGELHLIPPPSKDAPTLPPDPTLQQSMDILRAGTVQTTAKQAVQVGASSLPRHRDRDTRPRGR